MINVPASGAAASAASAAPTTSQALLGAQCGWCIRTSLRRLEHVSGFPCHLSRQNSLFHASSHSRPSISTNILCSSGIARVGWVSLSWMATELGNSFHAFWLFLNRRTMSYSEAAHQKYCCFSRSSLPRSRLLMLVVTQIRLQCAHTCRWGRGQQRWFQHAADPPRSSRTRQS